MTLQAHGPSFDPLTGHACTEDKKQVEEYSPVHERSFCVNVNVIPVRQPKRDRYINSQQKGVMKMKRKRGRDDHSINLSRHKPTNRGGGPQKSPEVSQRLNDW
jgi:hypothetical protein